MTTIPPHKALLLAGMLLQPNSGLTTAERARLLERIVAAVGQVLLLRPLSTRPTTEEEKEAYGDTQDILAQVEIGTGRKDMEMLTRHYLSVISQLPAKTAPIQVPELEIGEWVLGKVGAEGLVASYSFRRRADDPTEAVPEVRWTYALAQAARWTIRSEAVAAERELWDSGVLVELIPAEEFTKAPAPAE